MAEDIVQEGAAQTEGDKIVVEDIKNSTNNNKFCAEINERLGGNNEVSIYCKENGNLVLLDPSGAIPNNSVQQEDLVIYATLVARVKNKSLIVGKDDEVTTQINFVKGKDISPGQAASVENETKDPNTYGLLTTNWTNLGSLDSQLGEDLETFGMTNIDINFNAGFMPIITIDFVDIRGATLFEQGTCSPYGAFFHQPYPVFELTIKGYYGQPVRYYLACSKFTTSFDSSTGNYKSRGEFLGHSYAFLSDILLGYVMAAPYMEGSGDILAKIYQDYLKYYEEMGYNEGKTKFDPLNNKDGRPFTVFNYVKKIESLVGGSNSDQGAIADIQNSTELGNIDDLDNISDILDDIDKYGSDFKEEWIEEGGTVDGEIYTYGVTNSTFNEVDVTAGNTVNAGRKKITDIYDKYYGGVGVITLRIEVFNETLNKVKAASITTLESSNTKLTSDANSGLKLDLTTFNILLRNKRGQIREELNTQRKDFKEKANARIKQAIGFIPTIRSFFTVLLANTELFLELVKNVSEEAERYHQDNENDTFDTQCQDGVRVGGENGVVWAWPTYFEKKPNGDKGSFTDVETYPGNNPQYANWPEVKFVEEFLKALQEMQKDITEEISGEDPSVDVYDDVPGRDNYFPINSMETPVGASDCNIGYYNLNSVDDVYRTLGERFIIASNVSSPNANNLNTSIIAAAKNKFHQWVNEDSKNISKLRTTGFNPDTQSEVKGIFHGLEYLNHGQITPFFSAGAPFKPKKWGGEDESISNSFTWDSQKFYNIQNIEGYPYVDWASFKTGNIPRPMGMAGSSSVNPLLRDTGYSTEVQDLITNGGEIDSFRNTTVNNISASVENRTNYYKISTDEVLPNSPCSQKIDAKGDPDIVVILEPLYYTKKVIYFWGGWESVISRDAQIAQIPNEIKDRYFIVFAAGTDKSKQNTLESLKSAFKKLYSKDDYKRFLKIAQIDVNISQDIDNFSSSYFGYSAGGYALFKNTIANSDFIGLVDPSIEGGSSLTNGNKWNSSARLVWGSAGMIKYFTENNYKSLQDTIKSNSGKSEKINGLNHAQAITKWFEKYGSDLKAEVNNIQEELVNKILNESIEAETQPKAVVEKDVNSVGEINKGSKWLPAKNSGAVISKPMYENWEFLGRAEAHNFYNAITNTTLVGSVITNFDNVSEIYKEVINSLGMDEEDIYEDPYLAVYRYDRPLKLNRVSKKRGGAINLLPDIHEMNASDLVRLELLEDLNTQGGLDKQKWGVYSTWLKNQSGRAGFGLKEDSTYITSGVFNFLMENYGSKPIKGIQADGETKTNKRIVSLNSNSYQSVDLGSYIEFAHRNVGFNFSSLGVVEDAIGLIDNSYDVVEFRRQSRFTSNTIAVQDKFLTVDIYPDYEFNYLQFTNIFNETSTDNKYLRDGDWNWKYARSIYEFNNPKNQKLWIKGLTYSSWHTIDWGGSRNVTEYNINVLKVKSNLSSKDYKGLKSMSWNYGKPSLLPYSTSYTPKVPTVKEYTEVVKQNATAAWAAPQAQITNDQDFYDSQSAQFQVDLQRVGNDAFAGYNQTLSNQSNYQSQLVVTNYIQTPPPPPPASPPPSVTIANDAQQYAFNETDFFTGYGIQNSKILYENSNIISDTQIGYYSRYSKYKADKDADDAPNANFLNVGGTLTETPFWRHNFPAKNLIGSETNDSNVNKAYYSFWGGGYMNIADTIDYSAAGISKKLLYMGLKNDLDSYSDSSKFFPEGFNEAGAQGFYNGNVSNGKKTDIKYMLTNHNKGTVNVKRNDGGEVISTQPETNYNRTKAWKGALAYLFLANQYHKPWTGLYSSSLKNLGPQGTLGLGSITTKIPRHSVLLLGAVLWRMREAGLLESDNPRWNIEPVITNGVDPVNYPVLPEKIEFDDITYDTLNYVRNSSNSTRNISYTDQNTITNESLWPTNHGVRPPQLSLATLINGAQGSALTFPRADEWPAPNAGMIYAYDFFGDKGVTNPFKNQKKIWTPVMANFNTALLRYSNQQLLWTTSEKQVADFISAVEASYNASTNDLKKYSESAKESIGTELGGFANRYILNEITGKTNDKVFREKGLLEQRFSKRAAGTDEGFTRFTTLAHQLDTSFFYVGLAEANGGASYNKTLGKDTTIREAGRNFLGLVLEGNPVSYSSTNTNQTTTLDLNSEYVKNNAIEVEIKTFKQLDDLLRNKYTKADGTVLTVSKILAEVPYDEGTKSKQVFKSNEPKLFTQIGDDGESLTNNVTGSANISLTNITTINIDGNPLITPTIGLAPSLSAAFATSTNTGQANGSPYANTSTTNSKNFLVRTISTNINTDGYDSSTANWTSYWPQELEGKDGYVNPGNNWKYTNTFLVGRYYESGNFTDRSKEAQKKIAQSNPGIGIDVNSDNLYRYVAEWSLNGTQYYGNLKAKIGRKFLIITNEKPPQTQTGGGQQGLSENIQYYQELFKYTGFLRGYIPMGPEIWFMPTSVKKLFIEEFEKFVGDFNNFNNSEFDEILEIIDPLNFPTPQKTNNFAGIFEDELTYPNMFAEFGAKGTDAPYMLRLSTPNDVEKYGQSGVDKNGVSNLPEPIKKWLNFYTYDKGIKSAKIGSQVQNISVTEQKTFVSSEKGTGPYTIWNKLFNSYYIMGSTTPRTWWGEFPLEKDSNGNLVETTNKYFRFNKQELSSFLKGFADELNRGTIYNDYKQKIKDSYLNKVSAESLGANQDDDIRLTIYRSIKSIYDKWVSSSPAGKLDNGGSNLFYNPIGKGRLLIDHFSFVNRVNTDIGDRALVNIDVLQDLFSNTRNSIFGVTSDILDSSNFNFFPLPSYVDLSAGTSLYSREKSNQYRKKALEDMFRPISTQDYFSDILIQAGGPHFLCQYVGGNSQKLNLSVNRERGCLEENTKNKGRLENRGDSFTLDPEKGDCYQKTARDISEESPDSKGVVGFKVKFGSENQSHFLGLNLEQAESKETLESLTAIDQIANKGQDGGSGGFVAKGQSLYQIFLNRSYSCTVEALGNPMIQPLQYFELENVPMFYGSYLIRDVKHTIRPHSMKTTFTGDRVPYAVVPIVEDIISTFSIKPTQSGNRTSLSEKLGFSSSSGGGPCYEDRTRTITRKAGANYIIGDSKTPWLKKATTNTKVSLYNDGGLPNGGQSYLWESGKGVKWLTDAVNSIGPDGDAQSIIINIGGNDNYNLNVDFNALVEAIKSKFTAAKLYAIQGAYNYVGSNKNKTLADVTAFYKKFEELGVKLIDPPIGDGTQFTKDGVATTEDVHQQLDIYNTIMQKVNELVPEVTGEETSVTITEKVEVPCAGTISSGSRGRNVGNPSTRAIKEAEGLFVLNGEKVYIVNAQNGLSATDLSLRKLITDYNNFVKTAYPGKDWEFASNGVTRHLKETLAGGKSRSTASLHGTGMAIDVQFLGTFKQSNGSEVVLGNAYDKNDRPGAKRYGYSSGNFIAVQDEEFVQSIYKFLTTTEPYKSEFEWGAKFYSYCDGPKGNPKNCRDIPNLPVFKGMITQANRVAVNEMHHFQFNTTRQKRYWEPWESTLKKLDLPYPPISSDDRKKVYSWPFENSYQETTLGELQGDGASNEASLDPSTSIEYNGESSKAGDYGVSDFQLFTYLAWQQGPSGSAFHYSLAKNNGKKQKYWQTKYTEGPYKGQFQAEVNIRQNWPSDYTSKNGVKSENIAELFNNGVNKNGSHNKLATAFVDVQRQLYAKKLKEGIALINSDKKNRSGVPYSEIKAAFEKHQSGPECDFNSLVGFGMIENGLNTDTRQKKKINGKVVNQIYQTMFQMNSTYDKYKEVLSKLTKKKSSYQRKDYEDFQDWENIEVLTAAVIPRIKEQFGIFSKSAGFS